MCKCKDVKAIFVHCRFCGDDLPSVTLTSETPDVYVIFKSNYDNERELAGVSRGGFKLAFQSSKSYCINKSMSKVLGVLGDNPQIILLKHNCSKSYSCLECEFYSQWNDSSTLECPKIPLIQEYLIMWVLSYSNSIPKYRNLKIVQVWVNACIHKV